jgi:hypothetical protein
MEFNGSYVAALPPDVRKGSAFPLSAYFDFEAPPQANEFLKTLTILF